MPNAPLAVEIVKPFGRNRRVCKVGGFKGIINEVLTTGYYMGEVFDICLKCHINIYVNRDSDIRKFAYLH